MDLTKITTPYGLLDAETQKALREHGRSIEILNANGNWQEVHVPNWSLAHTYRVKPERPKPREWWLIPPPIQQGGIIFDSLQQARDHGWCDEQLIHVREFLKEGGR